VNSEGVGSYKARFDATKQLFDYGFGQFSKQEIVPANFTVKGKESIEVIKGKEDSVNIEVKEPIQMMVKSVEKDLYKPKLVLETESLEAEVEKGTVVGKVIIEKTEGTDYGFIDGKEMTVDVVTAEDVKRAGAISLFFQGIGNFFSSIWEGITGIFS